MAHFASRLRAFGLPDGGSMAPMLDMEAEELRPAANAFVADFVPRLRAETGVRRVLVYANLDWLTHVLRPAEWADPDVLLWVGRRPGPSAVRTHVVASGETLFGIARTNHTTVDTLARINHIADPGRIFPGQVLQLV